MVREACDASGSFDKSREGKELQDGGGGGWCGCGGASVWTGQRRCLWRVKLRHADEKMPATGKATQGVLTRRKRAGLRLRREGT